jgi:hypothetical protein
VVNPLPGGNFAAAATSRARWEDDFWVARLGIAYKFDSPDCCAAPLK